MSIDVIDQLVGIAPGDPLDRIRQQRASSRVNAQTSFDALFSEFDADEVSRVERLATAVWTAALLAAPGAAFYRELLAEQDAELAARLDDALPGAIATGPFGDFPAGPLSVENRPGPHWEPSDELRAAVGPRVAAALAHAHLLVYRPRDASPAALQALLDAGWSATGIVTLSQLVAFLNFQLRVVAGLSIVKEQLR